MLSKLLYDLISINSSTKSGANEAIQYCKLWLEEKGLTVTLLSNNGFDMLLCSIGEGDHTLIWNGHVDVVSAKESQFEPYEKDGRMFGRGSADMKAGVAAMMCALVSLKSENLSSKIQLQLVSDEEIGGFNCSNYLVDQGHKGDFVICSEPTQLGIGLQAKGILHIDIEVTGKSSHGSRPWEGDNAIEKAYLLYQKICSLPFTKESTELYTSPSINLAKITGGDAYNKVPDFCTLSIDIRYLPTQTKDEILGQISTLGEGNIIEKMTGEPVRTNLNNPYIDKLRINIQNTTFKKAMIFGQHGSADTRFFSAYGIPAIEFGPSGANWHGEDEYVEIQSILQYQQILINFAKEFHYIKPLHNR